MSKKWLSILLLVTTLTFLAPAAAAAATSAQTDTVHVVQRGETLYSIARRYGVDMWAIVRANNISNPNRIYVGQRLVIPGSSPPSPSPSPPPSGTIHVVQRGETLYSIARRYGVDLWAIVRANNISNPNRIYVGQRLVIPGSSPPTPPPPSPPPPSSGFQLGGQTHTLAHPNEMNYAGMKWVKFQVRWLPGMGGGEVAGRVQQGHSAGFKVLLSVVGGTLHPSSIDFAGFTEFLRQVAQQGPDAIEVWNEQNFDREWPAGQISPTQYVQRVLAPAYQAIKSVNSNILVISGAPTPTGYFGGSCTPAGCDDAPYIAGMVAAGAKNYLDCVGIHYNEGILPPSQTSGDPRGNPGHYTRYYWSMVNTYYNTFGGSKPLCFTELGYLSPDGYGALPSTFAWAAGTSVAEHAAWLAQAAQLSASSGKVRLMIVYNVDFTAWNSDDPQAGYAMIRPDGSCPACQTLHNVMP